MDKKILVLLLCLAALPARPRAAEPAPQLTETETKALNEIDKLLEQLSRSISDLDKSVEGVLATQPPRKGPPPPKAGTGPIDPSREYLARYREECRSAFSLQKTAEQPNLSDLVNRYNLCRSLASNDPGPCQKTCSRQYSEWRLTKSIVTHSPDAVSVCVSGDAMGGLGRDDARRICPLVVGPDTAEAVCEKGLSMAKGDGEPSKEMRGCMFHAAQVRGEESGCALHPIPEVRASCLENARYRKAYEAHKLDLCGDSVPCRVLMGDEKACEGVAQAIAAKYCEQVANTKWREQEAVYQEKDRRFKAGRERTALVRQEIERKNQIAQSLMSQLTAVFQRLGGASSEPFRARQRSGMAAQRRLQSVQKKFREGFVE